MKYAGWKSVNAGALLKETVEDLEWPSGGLTVETFLRRDPPLVQFSAHGLGDLRVTLPVRIALFSIQLCSYILPDQDHVKDTTRLRFSAAVDWQSQHCC